MVSDDDEHHISLNHDGNLETKTSHEEDNDDGEAKASVKAKKIKVLVEKRMAKTRMQKELLNFIVKDCMIFWCFIIS